MKDCKLPIQSISIIVELRDNFLELTRGKAKDKGLSLTLLYKLRR